MFRIPSLALALALVLPGLAPATAQAGSWSLDKAHTTVGFKIRHLMVSWVHGSFRKFEGTVDFEEGNPTSLAVDVTIDATSIDTGNAKRDKHLRDTDFFDVATYPSLHFKSTQARIGKDGTLELVGQLTLLGQTRELVLAVDGPVEPIDSPWGGKKSGASATGSLSRKAFGLSWNKLMEGGGAIVGDEVRLVLEVELNQPEAGK